MMMMRVLVFGFILIPRMLSAQVLHQVNAETSASFRGVHAVSSSVLWCSGSKGTVGRSVDGGEHWTFSTVKAYPQSDFRSIVAFDERTAVIASAGTPAVILRTIDGGITWLTCFERTDSAWFIDGLAFWDKQHGIAFGDPIDGHLVLLQTGDGGATWQQKQIEQCPELRTGEAAFAASNSTIRVAPRGLVWIATGGTVSRILYSHDYGNTWQSINCPIVQGKSSTGIFAFVFSDSLHGVVVGGDYTLDSLRKEHVFYTENGGKTWIMPISPTGGYRSGIAVVGELLVATGTNGTDISRDQGKIWQTISKEGYHAVCSIPNKKSVLLSGGKGRLAILSF